MATVQVSKLKPNEVAELACTYATLILHDEDIDINGEKLGKLIDAAGVKIDAFWPKLFAKALNGRNVADFFGVGGGEGGATADAAPAKETTKEAAKDNKKEAKKEEPKKVEAPPPAEDVDMGMGGLFD